MKKIVLLVAIVLTLVACKGPMSMVNLGSKTENSGLDAKVKSKELVMKLKEFKIENITENLEMEAAYYEGDNQEYGKRYVFDNGAEAYVGDGMLTYYGANAKYPVYYLNSLIEYTSDVDEEGLKICNDYFNKIGVSNMKLVGTNTADVDTIIDRINNGEDIMIGKDGSEENLREKLMDIVIYKFVKSLDSLNIVAEGVVLENEKTLSGSEAYIIMHGDSIIYAGMEYVPEDIIKSSDTNIISEEKAREILSAEYSKTKENSELKVEDTELVLITKPEKLIKHLRKVNIEYSPAYKFIIDDSYEKGGEVYKYSKTIYLDAVNGSVIN